MDWPAQSPYLNPIEHVWSILKRRLNLYSIPSKNLHELWNCVQEVYATITIDECQRLYASMPARIAAILEAKRRWTSF
jgi:transposase